MRRTTRPATRRIGALTGVALIAFGCVQAATGAMQPAKAMLGQYLLRAAWDETQDNSAPSRPWPWADIAPVARLTAPRIGADAIVLGHASGAAMAWGPGHVMGTAPLNAPGLAAIAGHRDSHLAFLADLRPGDQITLETRDGQRRLYRVARAHVVDSRDWRLPARRDGPATLALSTCWPFDATGDGPLRFVLYAEASEA